MSSESKQHWLDRNRPPRVQITYDVETLGSAKKMELPLVVGILADLLGNTDPGDLLKQRKFVQIDRDTFDEFMGKLAPTLKLGGKAGPAGLTFKKMEDFEPLQIVKQAPQMNKLLRERQRLVDVVAKLSGNDNLNADFKKVFDAKATAKAKADQVDRRREPFTKAVNAARTLSTQAQAFLDRVGAVVGVIQAAKAVHRMEGACDHLKQLLPGADPAALKQPGVASRLREKIDELLANGEGKALIGQLDTLSGAVKAADADAVAKALAALKAGPANDLQSVIGLEALASDQAKAAELTKAVEALRHIAEGKSGIGVPLRDLERALGADKDEQTSDGERLTTAKKVLLQKLPQANAGAITTAAEAYATTPSVPAALDTALQAAFPASLPAELELSQAGVLIKKHQQAITSAADARVIQARRFMDPKTGEKAIAARRDARQALETVKKIEARINDIHTVLQAPVAVGNLDTLHASLEELHGAAEAASAETQQQLDAFNATHP
ncbi:type VI secretion system contractile sheath small subunit [Corallococcus sp. AB030]|uniref:type VI secretion system contractile sheath small subunit n=1 Tax=Corallococcus TaxID=83461 RepID=UPI000EA12C05|nr:MULTISPECIES: type VI secretion system contractile sheath small subunit [Corallococcus]NNB97803.1 type VI secretion system contractile sheath small subunit [Corallococcus exiguus]RKH31192.1 type VI secretion system contractile sheath small subunit [Corallococcus sp. CA041A]RKI19081.1 type VI secretion system contractile sheath small subunit [Corallococcus sp. AB030]